ncbi:superoxide dismutase [Fe] [Bacteroidia bacterium]|nr:superoxide dismutase [Fe] [Bacteroidia bacterium]
MCIFAKEKQNFKLKTTYLMKKIYYLPIVVVLLVMSIKNADAITFELPALPYAANALEPVISEKTIQLHHGKHLRVYVTNLNHLIAGTKFETLSLEEIIKQSDGAIFNNAAQLWNHTLYFALLSPHGGGEPKGKLADAIQSTWGSFENFKKDFNALAVAQFGSGWAWLVKDASGKLSILKTSNADNPLTKGLTTILAVDVWEHAYYLDYQNRRPDYLTELWKIINWDEASKRY